MHYTPLALTHRPWRTCCSRSGGAPTQHSVGLLSNCLEWRMGRRQLLPLKQFPGSSVCGKCDSTGSTCLWTSRKAFRGARVKLRTVSEAGPEEGGQSCSRLSDLCSGCSMHSLKHVGPWVLFTPNVRKLKKRKDLWCFNLLGFCRI